MYVVRITSRGKVLRLEGVTDIPVRTPCTIMVEEHQLNSVRGILESMALSYEAREIKEYDSDIAEQRLYSSTKKDRLLKPLNRVNSDTIDISGKIKG